MKLSVKLEAFEGPLDLLLHLIEKNKIDIYDIPIAEITDQYLEYIGTMDRQDLDIVSDFLVMAATLLDIKTKMLLPAEAGEDGEEEDPRQELVERLLEYKMYKYISQELSERRIDAKRTLFKEPTIPEDIRQYVPPVDLNELLDGLTLRRLNQIFRSVMKRQTDKIDPVRSQFGKIEKEVFKVSDKISQIVAYARGKKSFGFVSLLKKQASKTEVVVTFLAVLELMKMGLIKLTQENICDEIWIETANIEQETEDDLAAAIAATLET